ncbi:MAG: hypothetical protein WKF96_01750 [Solirubrobacteraceae bacterium]
MPAGQTAVLRLYGYRDASDRNFRVQIDGGSWRVGTMAGTSAPSALFFTSHVLSAGGHSVRLESQSVHSSFTIDYYELDIAASASPPPRPPPVTPPTGTPPAGTCSIDPADGQSAIEAAIAACPDGRTVMFPAGRTYRQTDRIRVERRKGLVIDGNGSTFIKTSANDGQRARPNWELLEDSNVTLQNMVIRGALQPGPRGITPGNQFDHGVIIYGGDRVTVRDVKVYDVFGDFVTTAPSGFVRGGGALGGQVPRNIAIQRLNGRGAARMCVALTGGIGLRVEDSKLSDCRYGGIDIETDVAGEPLRDVHILRNTIAGYYLFAIGIAGPVGTPPKPGDIDDIEIRDNVTTTPSDKCWAAVNAERGPISGVVVAGNRLKTISRGVNLESVSSGSVSANTIEITVSPGLCGPPAAIPVRITNSPQVAVSNNTSLGY